MLENEKKEHNIFLYTLIVSILVVVVASFYSFYFKKNFDFIVETACNPETETCFFRDCEEDPEICPPNNLSYYNEYTISARDFDVCLNEDCIQACNTGVINCIKTDCTESDISEEICILPTGILDFSEEPINIEVDNIDNEI